MFVLPNNASPLDVTLHGLMRRYSERVPDVGRVVQAMIGESVIAEPSEIENDHVAFRTMGVPNLGIQSLEKIFLRYGYTRRDAFQFEQKKLDAFWYAPPQPHYPRIFVSELRVGDLSEAAQAIIYKYTSAVTSDPVEQLDLSDGHALDEFLHSPLWTTPRLSDYLKLANESEYAAWVIYNRYYLNHFTISVHSLPVGFNTIEQFNEFLGRHKFRLNNAGGVIKVSGDGLLKQSASVAELVAAEFVGDDGSPVTHQIPGSYIEFAERRPLQEFSDVPPAELSRAQRRDGFEAANADKIFESTYSDQVDN